MRVFHVHGDDGGGDDDGEKLVVPRHPNPKVPCPHLRSD